MKAAMRLVLLLAALATSVEAGSPPPREVPKFDPEDAEAIRLMSLDAKTFDSRAQWIYADPDPAATWKRQKESLGWK